MNSLKLIKRVVAGGLLASFAFAPLAIADSAKPKHSVKDVMKAIHKGEDNIGKKAAAGLASREELDRMIEYYQSLPLNEPPRGEKGSWNQKANALLKASRSLKGGEAGALQAYKTASSCKACHNVHKPE